MAHRVATMGITTNDALDLSRDILSSLEKRVTLAKRVESLSLQLERLYSNLLDISQGSDFCPNPGCLHPTYVSGDECSSCNIRRVRRESRD